tara:strand:+ start:1538 stop:1804 length:267 start_codon:yes stop_codon:yes gene_type:complete
MCNKCNNKKENDNMVGLDEQIKKRRRYNNTLSDIKSRLLNVRVDINILNADLEMNQTECVELANLMSNAYDIIDEASTSFNRMMNSRL